MAGAAPPPRLTEEVIKSDTRPILEQIGEVSTKVRGLIPCSGRLFKVAVLSSQHSLFNTGTLALQNALGLRYERIIIPIEKLKQITHRYLPLFTVRVVLRPMRSNSLQRRSMNCSPEMHTSVT